MAVDQYHLGSDYGADYATVVCHCTANETVTVGCDGREFTGTADTSVKYGRVKITVTGLRRGQKYPYTINGTQAGTLRTWRAAGEPIWIASGSCWRPNCDDPVAWRLAEDYDLDLLILNGDFPYADWADLTAWGRTGTNSCSSIADNADPDSYLSMHKLWREIPGVKNLMHNVPVLWVRDDHNCYDNEAPPVADGDDAHTGWRTSLGISAPTGTFAEFQSGWATSVLVTDAMSLGNPEPQAGESGGTGVQYVRWPLGDDLEMFLIDCIHFRIHDNVSDSAGKKMLGDTQAAWIDGALQASTKTWKFLVTSKPIASSSTNDRWSSYTYDRAARLAAWDGVTGLFSVAGDHHYINDQSWAADTFGAGTVGMSCLCACPATVYGESAPTSGYQPGVVWKSQAQDTSLPDPGFNGYGIFRLTADRVDRYILSHKRGLINRGYIEAGSNEVQYDRARIG